MVTSVFDNSRLYTRYHVELTFRDKLLGGIPKDTGAIEGWIMKGLMGLGDTVDEELLHRRVIDTVRDLGAPVTNEMGYEQALAVAKEFVAERHTNGFKVHPQAGLYIEGRQVKAMLREATNILFAGERWGATRKGPKAFLAERVFVEEIGIPLDRSVPDGLELIIGHVVGPKGPQSTLTYYEYVAQATIGFTVLSLRDCITPAQWAEIFGQAEMGGLGAARSQGHGTFCVTAFHQTEAAPASVTFPIPVDLAVA